MSQSRPSAEAVPEPPVLRNAEDYRRKAEEAEKVAASARDPNIKWSWTDIANQWRDLARQADAPSNEGPKLG
jgi:hypothetical protein